jgi:P27 family predicted phage terminase small subunit
MGRPRKPIIEKKLTGRKPGADSAGRKLPPEPQYAKQLPNPPATLKGEGLKEWKRLSFKMIEQGVLTEGDWAVFLQYCDAIQRRFDIGKEQNKEKIGSEEWHKLDRAWDRVDKQLTKAITELGLSPVTRSKVALRKEKATKPSDKFKRGLSVIDGGKR